MAQDSPSIQRLHQTLQPILSKLEAHRLQVRNHALRTGAIVLGFAVVGMFLLSPLVGEFAFILCLILAAVIWTALISRPVKRYRTHFKEEVIHRLIQHYDPGLKYSPSLGITEAEFRSCQIYRQRIDSYRCEDLVEGAIGATAFRFSEVTARYKTETTDSKGNRQTHWHTLFRGIFFVADFNKHFNGMTLVIPDVAERSLGGFGRALQGLQAGMKLRSGELVHLEDPEFEQAFAVYSTDQVEARYILSTSLMQRILEFRRRLDAQVALSFTNSCVYIAISTKKDYFEPPSLWTGSVLMTLAEIQTYLEDVRLAQDVVDDLNLNTRIWGKS